MAGDRPARGLERRARGTADRLLPLLPGALVVAFAFQAGGFFPGTVAAATVGMAVLLVLRITLAERPLAGLTATFVAGAAALGVLALWTVLSATWSDSPARALLEYDRVLLYLLTFLLFGLAGRADDRVRWMARGLAAGIVAVCACALVTRVLPDVWAVTPTISNDRLSFPVSYWNALGLLAGLGIILCFALTSDDREAPAGRVLAAAALPVLGATLLLTFSRGAIAASVLGLVAVVVVGRPRALLSGLLVAAPAVTIAVTSAYGADLLATDRPTTAAATAQGHDVALVVALCVVGAALARTALLLLDARLSAVRLPARLRRPPVLAGAAVVAIGAAVAVAVSAGVPGTVERQYDRFVEGDAIAESSDQRARLTDAGNNGRIDQWRVALDGFREAPVIGDGAGTYPLRWERDPSAGFQVEDAHSLYLEVAGELGLVGLIALVVVVALLLGGPLVRARGPNRALYGGLFGAVLAWAAHAGIDWHWEMPVVTLWAFAAGGAALAGSAGFAPRIGGTARVLVALGLLVLVIVPARVFLSEQPLRESREAFARGDCQAAVDRALDSIAVLDSRPDPYAIVGFCDVRLGLPRLAVRALGNAVDRDPGNWEYHYGLALVRGAAGLDPRGSARRALRRNPSEQLARDLVEAFDTNDPETWRRRALEARLPID